MPPQSPNPADLGQPQESPLAVAWMGFLEALRRLTPRSLLMEAIRQRRPEIVTGSAAWAQRTDAAVKSIAPMEAKLLRTGLRSGLAEVPGTALRSQVGSIASRLADARVSARVAAVHQPNRDAIQALIRSAGQSYRKAPSLRTLRDLADDIHPLIGLTPKQAAQLRRRWRAMRAAGESKDVIRSSIRESAEKMRRIRAKGIADRGVVESVSAGRHQAWVEARDAGEISAGAMKQWRDQGDGSVRPSHAAQTRQGPIPLDEEFPLHGVLFPPSPDRGCRCWHVLVDPDSRAEVRDAAEADAGRESTPEERAARAEALRQRRAEFEPRRQELEDAAAGRQGLLRRARTPTERAQLDVERAAEQVQRDREKLQSAWVHGSRGKTSVHFQEAARRELGIDVAVWNKRGHAIDEALVARYQRAVRDMYERTQAELRRRGLSTVRLLRGSKSNATPLRGVMESWSSDMATTKKFAGRNGPIMELEVDIRRILIWHEGPGWRNGRYGEQFEWVLLGGSRLP